MEGRFATRETTEATQVKPDERDAEIANQKAAAEESKEVHSVHDHSVTEERKGPPPTTDHEMADDQQVQEQTRPPPVGDQQLDQYKPQSPSDEHANQKDPAEEQPGEVNPAKEAVPRGAEFSFAEKQDTGAGNCAENAIAVSSAIQPTQAALSLPGDSVLGQQTVLIVQGITRTVLKEHREFIRHLAAGSLPPWSAEGAKLKETADQRKMQAALDALALLFHDNAKELGYSVLQGLSEAR